MNGRKILEGENCLTESPNVWKCKYSHDHTTNTNISIKVVRLRLRFEIHVVFETWNKMLFCSFEVDVFGRSWSLAKSGVFFQAC